jgi:RNA polymerase sigma factor (sigma-70 family)
MDEQSLQSWVEILEAFAWDDHACLPADLLAGLPAGQRKAVLARLPSDETLALLIQRDTLRKEAYEELFVGRYGPYLLRWFWHWSQSRDWAEDLMQDILVRFFENRLESFDAQRSFRSYLYQAARNVFLDWRRRQAHRRTRSLEGIPEAAMAEEPAADPEFGERLEGALRQLPAAQQAVMRQTIAGQQAVKIAQALGLPRNRIYALLFAGRRRLEQLLRLPLMTRSYRKAQRQ